MSLVRPALLFCAALALVACVHYPTPSYSGPGGDVIGYDSTGFTVNTQGYSHLLSEGATPAMFTVTPTGYHITNGTWHDFQFVRHPVGAK